MTKKVGFWEKIVFGVCVCVLCIIITPHLFQIIFISLINNIPFSQMTYSALGEPRQEDCH